MNVRQGVAGSSGVQRVRVSALQTTVALFTGLVLVQAILAGRGWFVDVDAITIHGYVGNAVFLVALVQLGLAYMAGFRGLRLVVSVAIALLVFAQVGLGYAGRESAVSASWHIPNGVLIFGLATVNCTFAFRPR